MTPFLATAAEQWPFVGSLVALCILGAYLRDRRLAGTAFVLFLNWIGCSAYVAQTADPYPWTVFATIDYVSGFTILVLFRRPPTLWQAAVGVIYAGMLVSHGGRGIIGTPAAVYYGWYFLHYAAWAQVAVVGTWGVYELARRHGMSIRRASPRDAFVGYRGARDAAR